MIRYMLYTVIQGPDTECIRPDMDLIPTVYVPIGIRYRLYTILEDPRMLYTIIWGPATCCIRVRGKPTQTA